MPTRFDFNLDSSRPIQVGPHRRQILAVAAEICHLSEHLVLINPPPTFS